VQNRKVKLFKENAVLRDDIQAEKEKRKKEKKEKKKLKKSKKKG
jgi:F0F1-type ATP synthase epsilon subunit